nr:MAG TPA: hypothetical protein [Caudoviricetes sp.]
MLSYINIFKRLYIYCAIANTLEVHYKIASGTLPLS